MFIVFIFCLGLSFASSAVADLSIESKVKHQQLLINDLQQQIKRLQAVAIPSEKNTTLDIAGFFDVTAHSSDSREHSFDLGALELDLQFDNEKNFAVSTALVWANEASAVAVAVLDYHANSHHVPTRGSLFGEPGYHIQFGRFDIPFGLDYEFFAASDRPNITAPLTTQRIQNNGFNGDGIRAYGNRAQFDYAVYLTNSLFESSGNSLGARVGFFPGRDPFRIHNRSAHNDLSVGYSWLYDMDENERRRNTLQALDINWRYAFVQMIFEYIALEKVVESTANEEGYNLRFIVDLKPMSLFASIGEWEPYFSTVTDIVDPSVNYTVNKLKRITIGGRYMIDDFLQIKLEYFNHLNTTTGEADFVKSQLNFQLVANF